MQLERTLPDTEDIRAVTAQHPSNEVAAVPGAADDLLDRDPFLGKPENDGIGLFPTQISLILKPLGGSEELGIDGRGADGVSICRMDSRTASRKARLAFSIRCQRSATWTACGSALAAARE